MKTALVREDEQSDEVKAIDASLAEIEQEHEELRRRAATLNTSLSALSASVVDLEGERRAAAQAEAAGQNTRDLLQSLEQREVEQVRLSRQIDHLKRSLQEIETKGQELLAEQQALRTRKATLHRMANVRRIAGKRQQAIHAIQSHLANLRKSLEEYQVAGEQIDKLLPSANASDPIRVKVKNMRDGRRVGNYIQMVCFEGQQPTSDWVNAEERDLEPFLQYRV